MKNLSCAQILSGKSYFILLFLSLSFSGFNSFAQQTETIKFHKEKAYKAMNDTEKKEYHVQLAGKISRNGSFVELQKTVKNLISAHAYDKNGKRDTAALKLQQKLFLLHSLEMSRAFPELKEIDKPARAEVLKLAKDIRKAGSVL